MPFTRFGEMTSLPSKQGPCALCGRHCALTFHHLVPRQVHRRNRFAKRSSKADLGRGIDICQLCHWGLHDLYSTVELAERLSSLEALRADEAVQRHVAWARKQRRGRVAPAEAEAR